MNSPLPPPKASLKIAPPSLKTLALSLIMAVIVSVLFEGLARLAASQSGLPAPNLMNNYEIGAKHQRLAAMVASEGAPDCFLVGSSVVLQGLNPAELERAYRQQTGVSLRCFNFAVSGLDASRIEIVARILAEQCHPKLIIYGTNYRDFMDTRDAPYQPRAWFAYRIGQPALDGWLEENSYFYRYYETLRWYLRANLNALRARDNFEAQLQPDGFIRETGVWPNIDKTPQPITKTDYRASADSLNALRQLESLRRSGVDVFLVEVPLPPNSKHLLINADSDYAIYIEAVESVARETGLPFWRADQLVGPITAAEGWADPIHLNDTGASLFSAWVASQLARARP